MVDDAIVVSIITGFLGSGKTTLLNRLLQHDSLRNSLVIINEFGEVGIDHLLVSAPVENIRLLSNGCLCCEVRGDLVDTLTDVAQKRASGEISAFDRVLVETTGLADPVPIIQTIVADAELGRLFRLDAVVGVVDAVHALTQLSNQDEARKQVAVSDVLLISKTDLVPVEALHEVTMAIKSVNAGAELISVVRGEIDPDLLFGRGHAEGRSYGAEVERWIRANVGSATAFGNRPSPHAGDVRTFTLYHDAPISVTGLTTWLSMLAGFKGPQLLRLKGIVNVDGEPYVLHAVQTVIHEAVRLERWPSDDRRTRLVFIVRGLERGALERTFAAFAAPEPEPVAATPHIDPAAYARFLEAAKQFT